MVDQEMKTSEHTEVDYPTDEPDMTGHLGTLGADLLDLGELQLQLLAVDARDAAKDSLVPAIWASLGIGFVIGCCPLALLGFSWWLTDVTSLGLAASSLLTALVGLLIAGLCLYFAWRGLRTSVGTLNRSRIEFASNLQWIKKILSSKYRRRWRKF